MVFEQAFAVVIGEEGGLSVDPADPGNWTGGKCGRGICLGTKYGIAASAHPNLDIPALTLDQARSIYRLKYWEPLQADELPPRLALLIFDAGVNCGPERTVRWLQVAVGCAPDGILGPTTIATVLKMTSGNSNSVCAQFQALRLDWMTKLPSWRVFGLGWARRICGLPYASFSMGGS